MRQCLQSVYELQKFFIFLATRMTFSPQLFIGHHVAVATENISCLSSVLKLHVSCCFLYFTLPPSIQVYKYMYPLVVPFATPSFCWHINQSSMTYVLPFSSSPFNCHIVTVHSHTLQLFPLFQCISFYFIVIFDIGVNQ